jgi:hypothetical protein
VKTEIMMTRLSLRMFLVLELLVLAMKTALVI